MLINILQLNSLAAMQFYCIKYLYSFSLKSYSLDIACTDFVNRVYFQCKCNKNIATELEKSGFVCINNNIYSWSVLNIVWKREMALIVLICLAILTVYYVKWLWSRRKIYMLSWKLPGPFAWPFIGNALSMRRIEGKNKIVVAYLQSMIYAKKKCYVFVLNYVYMNEIWIYATSTKNVCPINLVAFNAFKIKCWISVWKNLIKFFTDLEAIICAIFRSANKIMFRFIVRMNFVDYTYIFLKIIHFGVWLTLIQ